VLADEPVLDLVQGLRRLDGDRDLQQRLLRSFIENYHDLIQRLAALLTEDRGNEAIDLIHSVKGIAANLGAGALTGASGRLIAELRSKEPLLTRASFEATVVETIKLMQQKITYAVQPGPIKGAPAAPVSLQDTLRLLEPFIVGQEIIPDAMFESLLQLTDVQLPCSALMRELQQHLNNFDHPEALVTFNWLKSLDEVQQ
jgi:HPt (histidine-containing phosphotransfer) domain-containing protein